MADQSNWQEARSDLSKTVRWQEQPNGEKQEANTVFLGNSVEGEYVDKKDDIGGNGSSMYIIKLADNSEVGVWGNDIIDSKFAKIGLWSRVRITCLGFKESKKTRRQYRDFKVEFAPPTMKEATPETPTQPQPQY